MTAFLPLPLFEEAKRTGLARTNAIGLPLTPACEDRGSLTPEREAGPFFKPSTLFSRYLFPGSPGGEPITVAGFVLDNRCRPLPGNLVEIWHADDQGTTIKMDLTTWAPVYRRQ